MLSFNLVDTTPPTIHSCPSDIVTTVEVGTPNTHVSWNAPSATDLSGNVSIILQSHFPGDSFAAGKTTVTYVFADYSGNTDTCAFNVGVNEGKS